MSSAVVKSPVLRRSRVAELVSMSGFSSCRPSTMHVHCDVVAPLPVQPLTKLDRYWSISLCAGVADNGVSVPCGSSGCSTTSKKTVMMNSASIVIMKYFLTVLSSSGLGCMIDRLPATDAATQSAGSAG